MKELVLVTVIFLTTIWPSASALSEDHLGGPEAPAEVKSIETKVLLETDRVRVREIWLEPGAKTKTAEKKPRIVYSITDEHLKRHYPDGTTKEERVKAGTWRMGDLGTYAHENVGRKKSGAFVVDLLK